MNRMMLMVLFAPAMLSLDAKAAASDEDLRFGLIAEYYSIGHEVATMPEPKGLKPVVRRVDQRIDFGRWSNALGDFGDTNLDEYFYARWTGVLKVPMDGTYVFTLDSDDGSKLHIDGKLVADNDGVHAMRERSGRIELKAGNHDIKVEYFQNSGLAGCKLSWEPPGIEKQVIPATNLFHPYDKTLDGAAK